jgi:hypothetical protein
VPARVRVPARVVEEIGEDLREPHRIRVNHKLLRGHADLELMTSLVDQRTARFYRRGDHRPEIHGFPLQCDLASRDPRHIHQIVDETHEMADLALQDLEGRPRGRLLRSETEQRERVANRGEGVAQLVRKRGEEPILALVGVGTLGEECARVVLALARTQRVRHRAPKRGDPHGPLE